MRAATVPVPGARLATAVQLPDGDGPFPAVVIRTPYGQVGHRDEARAWAARGFAAVVQDVRGRHGSTGDWHPYRHEEADSAATLRWVRGHRWSDGRVVAAGASYAAHCALAATAAVESADRPDAVIAAVPALGLAETAREAGGVERLAARAGWWAAHGDRPDSDATALDKALARDPRLLEHLPLTTFPERLGRALPSWPALWDASRRPRPRPRAPLPLLAVGGTRDPFADDTLRLWAEWAGPARLLLGPWGHGLTSEPAPEARPGHRIRLGELYVTWARAALTGALGRERRGAVALGDSEHWYPAAPDTGERTTWPFGVPSGLRLLRGGTFVADPQSPVRSDDLNVPTGEAPDRALLVTPPLPRPLDLLGTAEARLCATADTPTADWAVRVVALDPAGRAAPLATGVVRRSGPPGAPAAFRVPLGPVARRLPAGTRLRVEVAGHHFPAHARNPHTGEDPVRATRLIASRRTVRTAGSGLLLPVVRGSRPVDPVQETRS
ncbi:CocE/NonD family hydrolase [Streptomyces peucetius]|uniref:CocE/NonD family hydrolase n=1 Tax=Streptomyces peucetius TaxID=1950 RepID=A0ABY6IH55_STRPE|nr:CocE/NonD family hydrolase [Streptomyces peucetius]UYQ65254.1 CocE/NonD family hydrolase [Streptomyces peucetius]